MKRALKWAGAVLGILVVAAGFWLAYVALSPIPSYPVPAISFPVDVTPERIANGKRQTELLCAGCHFDPETGALTGQAHARPPPQFGATGRATSRSTRSRGSAPGPTARSHTCSGPASP